MDTRRVPLTEVEGKVFGVLVAVARGFPSPPVLRAAGGWVRDKLLGRPSGDIDIALDTVTGAEFAEATRAFIGRSGGAESHVAVIRSNPDQSKHLETATMKIFGLPIDFTNLRTEEYGHESRIPQIKIGTPKQDAERRDLTINSMFYNVGTGEIEDWTEKGFRDLSEGIIRTPLKPLETFTDDPLRVMRSIRFAARLGFRFDPALLEAARSDTVKEALATKISRERIGKELGLMMQAPRFGFAVRTIVELGLWNVVFELPPSLVGGPIEWDGRESLIRVVQMERFLRRFETDAVRESHGRWLFLAALLWPLRDSEYLNSKRRRTPAVSFVLLESLKYSNRDVSEASQLIFSACDFNKLIASGPPESWLRSQLGMVIRRAGADWLHALHVSYVSKLPPCELPTHDTHPEKDMMSSDEARVHQENLDQVVQVVRKMSLTNAWETKPFFTGQELASILGGRPGPWIGLALEKEFAWQFDHPDATEDSCRQWVLANATTLTSSH